MNWTVLQTVAQISSERILNALPEGILIALFAWALLRVLRRQNSGTRFAVWFLALLAVAALPLLNSFGDGGAMMAARVSSSSAWIDSPSKYLSRSKSGNGPFSLASSAEAR